MKIAVSDIGPCQKELKVEVAPEAVQAARDTVERELMRVAHVPGFRAGKAPRDLVIQHYGANVREATIRRVIQETLPSVLEQAKLDLLGEPAVTQAALNNGSPMTYTARCEVLPAITVRGVKGLSVKRPAVHVSDQQVAQVLTNLQDRYAELVPVPPRPLAAGDFAVVDLTCMAKGKVIESSTDAVIQVVPQLVGAAPNPAPLAFEAPWRGTPATWTVTVKDVKVKQVPPLDEAFAKLVGVESLEALRARVRQDLERELTAQAKAAVEEQVVQALLEKTAFEVPASIVQSQAQRLLREQQVRLLYQGVTPTEVEQRQTLLVEQSTRDALRQVKIFFLLRQVAKDQQLAATDAEVEARLQAIAATSRRSVGEVRAELQQRQLLGELAWDVTRQKVMDFLLGGCP